MTRGVFTSYSSQDRDFVQRLVRDLKDHEIPVWFDESKLEPGDSIIQKIEAGIDRMAYLIVVLSPASVDSRWVQEEIRMALPNEIFVAFITLGWINFCILKTRSYNG